MARLIRGGAIADPASQAKGRGCTSRSIALSLLRRIGSCKTHTRVAHDDDAVAWMQAERIGLHNGERASFVGSHDEFSQRHGGAVVAGRRAATADKELAPAILPDWRCNFPHRQDDASACRG